MSTPILASVTPSYVPTILIAALTSAVVAIIGYWQTARSKRLDRHRQLFADAYRSVVEYREYPYKIRRREPDADRTVLTDTLSTVQAQLSLHIATLDIETPRVAPYYKRMVAETKRVAGPQIAASWDQTPPAHDAQMHIADVDYSELRHPDSQFIKASRHYLSLKPNMLIKRQTRSESCKTSPRNGIESHAATAPVAANRAMDTAESDTSNSDNKQTKPDGTAQKSRLKEIMHLSMYLLLIIATLAFLTFRLTLIIKNIDKHIEAFLAFTTLVSAWSALSYIFKSTKWIEQALIRIWTYSSDKIKLWWKRNAMQTTTTDA